MLDQAIKRQRGSSSSRQRHHGRLTDGPATTLQCKQVKVELILSHVEDPFTWHCQKKSSLAELADMDYKMNELCPNLPSVKGTPSLLQVYGAQFSEDLSWYRCKILSHRAYEKSLGVYIDYGNVELIEHSKIVVLPDYFMLIQPFSFKCKIQHPSLAESSSAKPKDHGAVKYLSQFVTKEITVRGFESKALNRHCFCITEAISNGEDIVAGLKSRVFCSPKSFRSPKFPLTNTRTSLRHTSSTSNCKSFESFTTNSQDLTVAPSPAATSPAGSGEPMHTQNGPTSDDPSLHHLGEMVKLSQQLMVNRLQLPSSPALDLLENAMDLVPEDQYLSLLESSSQCHSLLDSFSLLQHKIHTLQDKDQLKELVEERTRMIPLLQHQFDELSSAMESFPIIPSLTALEDRLDKIKKCYKDFLVLPCPDELTFEKATEAYQNLKNNKKTKLEEIRRNTTLEAENFAACLLHLTKYLPLDSNLEPPTETFDIAPLIQAFEKVQASIEQEMVAYWPQEGEKENVAALSQMVVRELEGKHGSLHKVHQDFTLLFLPKLEHITEDFGLRPNPESLNACRSSLRSIKSRLRHRLADRQDLLEYDDGGSQHQEQLGEVNGEIDLILKDLHLLLIEEDNQLRYLADLGKSYFPELSVEHPDLHLDLYTNYGGLVKPNWERKFFKDGEQLRNDLMLTQFAGNPALIQKFNLVARDQFLERLKEWASKFEEEAPKGVLGPTAVFFSKKKDVGYVVSASPRLSLLTYPQEQPLALVERLVEVVKALHAKGFLHGGLSPYTTILGPPIHVLPLSPSLTHPHPISPEDDIHALGLITLWLCQPSPMPFDPELDPEEWLSEMDCSLLSEPQLSLVRSMLGRSATLAQVEELFKPPPESVLDRGDGPSVAESLHSRHSSSEEEQGLEEDSSLAPTTDSIMDLFDEFRESLSNPLNSRPLLDFEPETL